MDPHTLHIDYETRTKRQVSQQFEPGRDPYNTLDRWNQEAQDWVVFGEWVTALDNCSPTESERLEMCGPDPVRNSDLGQ